MENENKSGIKDVLGIAPYGEAFKILVEKGFEGASAILSKICLPAAEELGLMFRDKIKMWRLNNIIKILEKTHGKIDFSDDKLQFSLHPRIANELLEHGALCDDDILQEMWSGLLASSTEIGVNSDQNLLYFNVLKQLTPLQAKLINYTCQNCKVKLYENTLLHSSEIVVSLRDLQEITSCSDVHQLDAEMDSLRTYNLIDGGFHADKNPLEADLQPSSFLLLLYPKTNGYKGSLSEFYSKQIAAADDPDFIN